MKKDPDIWKKLDAGHYQLVFASPEVLFTAQGHFLEHTMKQPTTFSEKLVQLAVDEAHMIWDSQNFRPLYPHLGRLRVAFPGISILAMSATLAPPALSYCQKILGMNLPSDCVTLFGRRYNINILIAEQPPERDCRPILELLPRKASDLSKMPKMVVFVDDVKLLLHLVYNARFYIAKLLRGDPDSKQTQAFVRQFVRTYYSSIQAEKKAETETLFKSGLARLVFATDAMSHGVDFGDIEVVIQWGMEPHLSLNSLDQRKGRAARMPDLHGIFVAFVPKAILNHCRPKQISNAIAQQLEDDQNSDSNREHIQDKLYSVTDEPASQLDGRDIGHLPNEGRRDVERFKLAVENTPESDIAVRELRRHMYQTLEERREIELVNGDSQNRRNLRAIDRIDPGNLWFCCSPGCKNRLLASFFEYPDVFYDKEQLSWCCDYCAIFKKKLDPFDPVNAVHGIPLSLSFLAPKPPVEPKKVARNIRKLSRPVLEELKPLLTARIVKFITWKRQRFVEKGLIRLCIPAKAFLDDEAIEKVVRDVKQISTLDDLKTKLKACGCAPSSMLLREKDLTELFSLIDVAINNLQQSRATPASANQSEQQHAIPVSANQSEGPHTISASSIEKTTVRNGDSERENVANQSPEHSLSVFGTSIGEAQVVESLASSGPLSPATAPSPSEAKFSRSRVLPATTHTKRKALQEQAGPPKSKRPRQALVDVTNRNNNRKKAGLRMIQCSGRLKEAMQGNI